MHYSIISIILMLLSSAASAKIPTFIFAHGLGGNETQVRFYKDLVGSAQQTIRSFNFPHVIPNKKKINTKKVSLAQNLEIDALDAACKKVEGDRILAGVSLGASTILTYVGMRQPLVKALILESPFDSVNAVIKHQAGKWRYLPGINSIGNAFIKFGMYPAYDPDGVTPKQAINYISKDIPILLIHSKKDEFIPIKCSRKLYRMLVKRGHKNVHLLELDNSLHAHYLAGTDAQIYKQVVHAFYRHYGLPYNAELANAGQHIFEECQPATDEVKNRR